MAAIKRFEELNCWQLARELENLVWELTLQGSFSKDFSLKDQINRSTGSTMDNIAEGFGRASNREFIQFLIISRGSIIETQSQLIRAKDRKHISNEEFEKIYLKASEVVSTITNFINYLKKDISRTFRA